MNIKGTVNVLVFANECLSSCYIHGEGYGYRHFGSENVDWQAVACALWGELPLGFILFWLDERETWSISARATPEVVGVKSALCYARQSGVVPLAIRLGKGGDLEVANVFLAGSCPVNSWQRHRTLTRVSNKLVSCLVATFSHVSFWRRGNATPVAV